MPHSPSTSIMIIPLLASIFVKKFSRKFLHLRENFHTFAKIFAKMRKCNFCFGPDGNWILTLPHTCLFYPPKMRCYGTNITPHVICMPYHCKILWIFVFSKLREIFAKFSRKRKFARNEVLRKSSHFRMIFAFSRKLKNAFSFQP
jgi:hypothetical protein